MVGLDTSQQGATELRLLSIIEALTVTGPVKPMLTFSRLMGSGFAGSGLFTHAIVTTRRSAAPRIAEDELLAAVRNAGAEGIALRERRPFDAAVLPQLTDAVRRFRPHIVETHDCKSHFLFHLARGSAPDMRRLPWIAFHHGYTRTSWRILAYQQLDRLTLRRTDQVITVCRPFARSLESRGVPREKISVITNTIEPPAPPPREVVERTRTALDLAPSDRVILTVGRLSREKGHRDLIAAFRRIRETMSGEIRLVIVGDGPERAHLERLAAPHGRGVVFAGQIRDPWPVYSLADLFVLPSHSEGLPLVILEAMAAARPIIATAVGGIPEILTDRCSALLIPPRSPGALASAIAELLEDEALRTRLASEASAALTRSAPPEYARRLLSIYALVLSNRQPSGASHAGYN